MSNLQNQEDKVVVQTEHISNIDRLVTDIKREYGSFRAFSANRQLPIVTYTASVDGTSSLQACTDLSLLRPDVAKDFQETLSEFHNSQLLHLISELSHLLGDLFSSLSDTKVKEIAPISTSRSPSTEHFSDHPDYGDFKEFENES